VRQLNYITLLVELLDTTPLEVVQNYLAVQFTLFFGYITTYSLQHAIAVYQENEDQSETKWAETCARMSDSRFSLPIRSRMYVDSYFSALEKQQAVAMVQEIKQSFRLSLQTNSWLDSHTK